ncbi:MAG: hypothetical protein ACYDCL_21465 [Myxococcales bacterium]
MNDQAQEGVFLLLLAIAIVVLWLRGYLTSWIDAATSAIGAPPTKVPFNVPGAPIRPPASGGVRLLSAVLPAPTSGQLSS